MNHTLLLGSPETCLERLTIYDSFTSMNNMGVVLLRDRKYDQAASCFNGALKYVCDRLFRAPLAPSPSPSSPPNADAYAAALRYSTLQAFYLLLDDTHHPVDSSSLPPTDDLVRPGPWAGNKAGDDDTYVFRHPIVVSESGPIPNLDGPADEEYCAKLSSMTLYNMALTFHLAALDVPYISPGPGVGAAAASAGIDLEKTRQLRNEILGQALFYYDISYRILVSEQSVLVCQAMVILNNIGQIHRLLDNQESATSCFQHLLTTMVYLQQTGEAGRIHHWDSFFSNVLGLIAPQPGPAPAA